jgi:polyhydroxybutyrate depolymerase
MKTRRSLVTVVAIAALAATGCIPSAPPPGTPSGCGKPASPVVAQQRYLISGGVVRSYLLTVPDHYDPQHRTPLILDFHGHGSNAIQQSAYTQIDAKAKSRGFIVATPNGIDNQFDFREPSVDFTYTQDLVRYLDATLCVSATKRFSTGMSNGGAMSGAVACLPELHLEAIAGVTAMLPACANGTQVPVLYFHGNADPIVNYAVAGPVIASWATRDGCDATPTETRIEPDIQKRTFTGCDAGLSATLYTVEGGGHTWPDGLIDLPQFGNTTRTVDATNLILDFFAAQ